MCAPFSVLSTLTLQYVLEHYSIQLECKWGKQRCECVSGCLTFQEYCSSSLITQPFPFCIFQEITLQKKKPRQYVVLDDLASRGICNNKLRQFGYHLNSHYRWHKETLVKYFSYIETEKHNKGKLWSCIEDNITSSHYNVFQTIPKKSVQSIFLPFPQFQWELWFDTSTKLLEPLEQKKIEMKYGNTWVTYSCNFA